MIKIPQTVLDALTDLFREIHIRVEIEFDPGIYTSLNTALISMNLQKDLSSGDKLPFGGITYNQMTLTLDNINKEFIANNPGSPYYGKLVADLPVHLSYVVTLPDESQFEIFGGLFKTDSWKATTESSTATVICYDNLQRLGQMPSRKTTMYKNIAASRAFELLMQIHGVDKEDYIIESGLSNTLQYFWVEGDLFVDALQALAISTGANVYCDILGKVHIAPAWNNTDSVDSVAVSDSDILLGTKVQPQFKDSYSDIVLKYKKVEDLEIGDIYNQKEVYCPTGTSVQSIVFKNTPIVDVIAVTYQGVAGIAFTVQKITSSTCNLVINNGTGKPQTVNIKILGQWLKLQDATCSKTASQDVTNTLVIDCPFAMAEQTATNYVSMLGNVFSQNVVPVDIDVRALPHLDVGDRLDMASDYTGIVQSYFIQSMDITFQDGLTGTYTLTTQQHTRKTTAFFISPGMLMFKKEGDVNGIWNTASR